MQKTKPKQMNIMGASRLMCGRYNYILWIIFITVVSLDILSHVYKQCTNLPLTNRTVFTRTYGINAISKNEDMNCTTGTPCQYSDEVDLRIIVMTYNRDTALMKLLQSLDNLILHPGDTVALEIWIDRSKDNKVHDKTVRVAEKYIWQKGVKRVHIQNKHAGIYGQWIDTWRPKPGSSELAIFLEDDLSISPYAWIWLKAVHKEYGKYPDCLGYTLQSERIINSVGGGPFKRPKNDSIFMYKMVGSWGFAPHPKIWKQFQDWFLTARKDKSFHPYVDKLIMTGWYKKFEKSGTQDSMWTMWFIYFIDVHNLFGVYNNIPAIASTKDVLLAAHREEPGLHYHGKPRSNVEKLLLTKWNDRYTQFPQKINKYGFDGKPV